MSSQFENHEMVLIKISRTKLSSSINMYVYHICMYIREYITTKRCTSMYISV